MTTATTPAESAPSHEVAELLRELPGAMRRIHAELDKRIVGQDEVISELLVAMLCRGHILLIGVPGLAKTLLIRTLGEITELRFNRIQFTPDMMPSDITGTEIVEEDATTGFRAFKFHRGPVFSQLLLADEINRTPPKTQAALLEAMQEHAVTAAGRRYVLDEPFFVLATQNPIEQEGTYPLPEAQLDRFMFSLHVGYPSREEELTILDKTTGDRISNVEVVLTAEKLLQLQSAVRQVFIPRSVAEFIVDLVGATRPGETSPDSVKRYVKWGAGPRASQCLALAGKAFAALDGRFNVSKEDVARAAKPVLRHRVLLNYHAEAEGRSVESLIDELLKTIR